MSHIQITIDNATAETAEILIARLSEAGFEGFEEKETGLVAFIPEADWQPAPLEEALLPFSLSYTTQAIAERNWNEEWEKHFEPVRVGDFCAVRASFHQPVKGVEQELIITPKMSFGTGHHATTYMMIEAMQAIGFAGRSVLDFGTGTGVLAILAAKLGAGSVLAIDNDEWSINNALENVAENQVFNVSVRQENSLAGTGCYAVLLANINKNVLLYSLPSMTQHLEKDGVIVMSGLLQEDEQEIADAAKESGFIITRKWERGNWICLRLER